MSVQPIRVTVRTVCRFHLDPPPPRLPRISVTELVALTLFILMRIIFGVVYFHDCPQHPNIPNYLLGKALLCLLLVPYTSFPCESFEAQHPRGFKLCLIALVVLVSVIWNLGGALLIFSAYQPNYDPTAADGLYCNKTLYTFAFWNAVLEMFSIGVILAKHCRSILIGVSVSPIPVHSNV